MEKIRISDVWVPPAPDRVLKACGIDLLDRFSKIVCNIGNDSIRGYCDVLEIPLSKTLYDLVLYYTGMTDKQWKDGLLMEDARWYLRETILSISEIAEAMHFSGKESFNIYFRRYQGKTATQYRASLQVVEEKITYIIKRKGE